YVLEVAERAEVEPRAAFRDGCAQAPVAMQPPLEQRGLPRIEPVAQRVDVLDERALQPRRRQRAQYIDCGALLLHALPRTTAELAGVDQLEQRPARGFVGDDTVC